MRQILKVALGLAAMTSLPGNATMPGSSVVTAPAAPPDGTYTYALSRNGTDLGTSTVVVVRRDATRAIETNEAGNVGAARARIVAAYGYADLSPQTYIATYQAPFLRTSPLGRVARTRAAFGEQMTVRYRSDDAGVSATIDGSSASVALPLPVKDGKKAVRRLWILDGPFMTGALFLPAYRRRSGEARLAPASVAFDDAAGASLVAQRLTRATPQFPKTPKSDSVLEEEGVAKIWFDPGNYIVHEVRFAQLNVDARLLSFARALQPAPLEPAPSPTPKARLPRTEVTFSSADGTRLGGVLDMPLDAKKLPGVIVFVPPGPNASRDFGGDGPEPMFPELALAFARRGYAVVRYDTRGVAKSGGTRATESWDRALADAKAALQFAASADGVDSARVYALGYGNGADLAMAAAADPEVSVAGVVALAPSVLAYRECAKRATNASGGESAVANDGTWRKTAFAHDPTALAMRTRAPLFVLHPGMASCGESSGETTAYDERMRAANSLATVVVASDLGARFGGRYDSDSPANTEAFLPYRFDASTASAIADWLDNPKTAAAAGAGNASLPGPSGPPRTNPRPPPAPGHADSSGVPSARSATPQPPSPAPARSSDVLPGQVVLPGLTPPPQVPPSPPAR